MKQPIFMKKTLLVLASGSMAFSTFSLPVFASEEMQEESQATLLSKEVSEDIEVDQMEETTSNQENDNKDDSLDPKEQEDPKTDDSTPNAPASTNTDSKTIYEWKLYAKSLEEKLATASEAEKETLQAELDKVQAILEGFEMKPMYRLYNKNSGEHFYTGSQEERDTLIKEGWQDEGTGWYAPVNGGEDVYRLYNPEGDHHYTTDANERDALVKLGWKDEGIGWKSFNGDGVNAVPIFRQYNPNEYIRNHNYTASLNESQFLIGIGWKDEKVGWYGLTPYTMVESDKGIQYIDLETMKPLTGLQKINGQIYFLDPENDGISKAGVVQDQGKIYIVDGKGNRLTGWTEWEGKTYYLDEKTGEAKIGTMTLTKDQTGTKNMIVCFGEDGAMLKDCEVDGVKYGADGSKQTLTIDERLALDCLAVYDVVGRDLSNCFNWTYQTIVYKAFNPQWRTPPEGRTHIQNFALYGLESQTGNCYTFASTFLMLARNLGYEGRVAKGTVRTVNGDEEHGWCELLINGKWYIFDGSFAQGFGASMCYMQPKDRPTFIYTVEAYYEK